MFDLKIVIFLKFVRFGANFAQTIVLGYSLMKNIRRFVGPGHDHFNSEVDQC